MWSTKYHDLLAAGWERGNLRMSGPVVVTGAVGTGGRLEGRCIWKGSGGCMEGAEL